MISVTSIQEVREFVFDAKAKGKLVGLVPTMGSLHDGHLSLVKDCREQCEIVVMSIFVNPIQFDRKDDLAAYPVDLENDKLLAEKAGVDLLFIPDTKTMYVLPKIFVVVDGLNEHLCGATRPGHFMGVLTIVAKLFNIVSPDIAVFGQKDFQQVRIVQKMVTDLNFPIKIVVALTVREESGLAMSSRNKNLSPDQRERAVCIYAALKAAASMIKQGERSWRVVEKEMHKIIKKGSPDKIEYISAVANLDLMPIKVLEGNFLIAVAAYFGSTRLIDNAVIIIDEKRVVCAI